MKRIFAVVLAAAGLFVASQHAQTPPAYAQAASGCYVPTGYVVYGGTSYTPGNPAVSVATYNSFPPDVQRDFVATSGASCNTTTSTPQPGPVATQPSGPGAATVNGVLVGNALELNPQGGNCGTKSAPATIGTDLTGCGGGYVRLTAGGGSWSFSGFSVAPDVLASQIGDPGNFVELKTSTPTGFSLDSYNVSAGNPSTNDTATVAYLVVGFGSFGGGGATPAPVASASASATPPIAATLAPGDAQLVATLVADGATSVWPMVDPLGSTYFNDAVGSIGLGVPSNTTLGGPPIVNTSVAAPQFLAPGAAAQSSIVIPASQSFTVGAWIDDWDLTRATDLFSTANPTAENTGLDMIVPSPGGAPTLLYGTGTTYASLPLPAIAQSTIHRLLAIYNASTTTLTACEDGTCATPVTATYASSTHGLGFAANVSNGPYFALKGIEQYGFYAPVAFTPAQVTADYSAGKGLAAPAPPPGGTPVPVVVPLAASPTSLTFGSSTSPAQTLVVSGGTPPYTLAFGATVGVASASAFSGGSVTISPVAAGTTTATISDSASGTINVPITVTAGLSSNAQAIFVQGGAGTTPRTVTISTSAANPYADWHVFGVTSVTPNPPGEDQLAGATLFSNVAFVGSPTPVASSGDNTSFAYVNAMQQGPGGGTSSTSVSVSAVGQGFSFTAPANTSTNAVETFFAATCVTVNERISSSDNSFTPVNTATVSEANNTDLDSSYLVNYQSAGTATATFALTIAAVNTSGACAGQPSGLSLEAYTLQSSTGVAQPYPTPTATATAAPTATPPPLPDAAYRQFLTANASDVYPMDDVVGAPIIADIGSGAHPLSTPAAGLTLGAPAIVKNAVSGAQLMSPTAALVSGIQLGSNVPWTVCAWFDAQNFTHGRDIFASDAPQTNHVGLEAVVGSGGIITFYGTGNTSLSNATATISQSTIHRYCAEYDGSTTMTGFLDGVQAWQRTGVVYAPTTTYSLGFGDAATTGASGFPFIGELEYGTYAPTAWSASTAQTDYNDGMGATAPVPPPGATPTPVPSPSPSPSPNANPLAVTPTSLSFGSTTVSAQNLTVTGGSGTYTIAFSTPNIVSAGSFANGVVAISPAAAGTTTAMISDTSSPVQTLSVAISVTQRLGEMPLAAAAILDAQGADGGNAATNSSFPFLQFTQDLQFHNIRGESGTTNFRAGLTNHAANANTGFCGSIADQIYSAAGSKSDTQQGTITGDIVAYELQVAGVAGAGTAGATALDCSYFESLNEWDVVGAPQAGTLATATTAGATVTETTTHPGNCPGNFYLCPGMYVHVTDGSNSEYVLVTSACYTGTCQPNHSWTATFANAHAAGTAVSIDWAYQAAQHQLVLYNVIKKASTGHPEFAGLTLTTIPFANAQLNLGTAESVQMSATGKHLYQVADALNEHQGICNASYEEPYGYENVQKALAVALTTYGDNYPFAKGIYAGESTTVPPDSFGNGLAVPYVPANSSGCDAPSNVAAIYASYDPLYLYDFGIFAKLYEPIISDYSGNHFGDSFADWANNPKPAYYFRANTLAFLTDATFSPLSINLLPLGYTQSAGNAWAGYSSANSWGTQVCITSTCRGNVPSGATIFHTLAQMQSGEYRMAVRMIPYKGLFPQAAAQPTCTPTGGTSSANYGQCANIAPPTPFPAPTNAAVTLNLPGYITRAKINQQQTTCDIPNNIEFPATISNFTATPAPTFSVAPNSTCGAYVASTEVTQDANKDPITLTLSVQPAPMMLQMGTGSTPLPVITPIAMVAPRPTPTPDINGHSWPYNQFRNGVFNPVVAH